MDSAFTVDTNRRLPIASDRDEDTAWIRSPLSSSESADRFHALKAVVRRKRRRPTSLAPLVSPQHPSHVNEISDDDLMATTPRSHLHSPTRLTGAAVPHLPPLVAQVLERKKLFLNPRGESVVGIEEILRLQELSPPKTLRASPLQLIAVPRKVFDDDEVALMPCHSLHYRYVPSLDVEKWKEPLRDRDKNWRDDELGMVLSAFGSRRDAAKQNKMTSGPSTVRKGTWRKLDSQRLQIKNGSSRDWQTTPAGASTVASTAPASPRDPSLPGEVLLRSQGAMISRTYCIVTIYGVGLYGRLYSEGLADRQGQARFLRIDTYDPAASRTASLRVSLADLEWVFEAHSDLLAAGKKQTLLSKVVALLYFKYPEDDEPSVATDAATMLQEETPRRPPSLPPILCISPDERMNEAARRRLEREERLRAEEQERLRLLALLMKQPRRARHRVVLQLARVSGHEFLVSIFHFPSQVRNFLVVAYQPRASRTLTVSVGVGEAASLSRVFSMPHKWSPDQKQQIAAALIPRLFLRGVRATASDESEPYRVALAIREDRKGAQGAWLSLPLPTGADSKKDVVVAKYKKDGLQELQLSLERRLRDLDNETSAKTTALHQEITAAEASIAALKAKDAELKELIEAINSGKGLPVAALADETHKAEKNDARRGHKAARKTIKDQSKALQARVAAWKRELELASEHDLMEREKAQATFDKAVEALTQRAVTATLPLWFDPRERKQRPTQSEPGGNRQRTRLHRAELRDGDVSVTSGACRVGERRYRFSLFSELPVLLADEQENEADAEALEAASEWFLLLLYDSETSSTFSLRLTRLGLIAFAKTRQDAVLEIPSLRVSSSPAVQRVAELDQSFEAARRSLATLKKLKKNDKKRRQLLRELETNRRERRVLARDKAPWSVVVNAVCCRLRIDRDHGELHLDRCIYRATLGIVSLAADAGDAGDGVVDCEVSVTLREALVMFHARDPATSERWSLTYADSVELVKEFAVETQLEMQLHLEAIAMTLLLYVDERDATRQMRFEE